MKIKKLLIASCLTLAVGVGVVAGLNYKPVKEADAYAPIDDQYTLYMYISEWGASSGWNAGGEDYYLHYWGESTGFQKLDSTSVTGLWEVNIPSSITGGMFLRVKSGITVDSNIWDSEDLWGQSDDIPDFGSKLDAANNTVCIGSKGETKYGTWWSGDEYQPELVEGQAFLRGTWTHGWCDLTKEMTLVSENVYEIENVLLSSGSQIKVTTINASHIVTWHDAEELEGNSGATFDGTNVTINTTGNYTVSINVSTKVYTVDVYEDVDLTAAETFADDFKTSMGKYCPIKGTDAEKGLAKLVSEWSDFAYRFNGELSEKAQGYLKTLDDGGKIVEFRGRYDSILSDYYSTLSPYNFLNRTPSSTRNTNSVIASDNMTMIAAISIIALVSISAVTVLVIVKKRKHN